MGRLRICSAHKLGSTVNIAARMVAAFTHDLLTLGAGDWHSIARLRWTSPACDQPKYDFRTRPEAHSRLVGLYMLFYAIGSGLGAISTTATYAYAGWLGVCSLGACVSLLALLFWWRTMKL